MSLRRRHLIFYIAASTGAAAFLIGMWFLPFPPFTVGANMFFVTYLGLTLHIMPRLSADHLSMSAAETDQPVIVIFLVTAVVVCIGAWSLFLLINGAQRPGTPHLVFALASLPLGWATIHTMAALHYAHVYWQNDRSAKAGVKRQPAGGLAFPGTERPQGWDFLYYSLVIGMTAQTADTNITATSMRRMTMIHSVFSFFFNTVIVAAAVNLVVSFAD